MLNRATFLLATAAALCVSSQAFAGSVTFVSSDQNLGSGWRTSTVTKGLDVDLNNVLGTSGYFLPNMASSAPAFLSSFGTPTQSYAGNGLYSKIDDPTTTPGITPSTTFSGTFNPFPGQGVSANILLFTLGVTAPNTIQVSLMIDNLDVATYNPAGVRITQTNGLADSGLIATTSLNYNNGTPDWLYFTINNAKAGDSFAVIATGGSKGAATIGAIAFDSTITSPTPEPSSFALLLFGVGSIAVSRLRRRA